MKRPIILCGLGRMGARVMETLRDADLPVVVVDNACRPDDPRLLGARLVCGDCRRRDLLEEAGVADCGGVLVVTNDDLLNVTTALTVRAIHPEVRVVVRMFNQNLLDRLGGAVHNVFALSTSLMTAPIVALTALTGQALGAFRLEGRADDRRQVAELTVQAGSELRGRTLASALADKDALALAHLPDKAPPRFLLEVDPETPLEAGDRLVVCGEPGVVAALMTAGGDGDAPHLRWAGWLRRFGRMTWGTIGQIDRAVLICTLVLLLVLLGSTLLLHSSAGGRLSLGAALLRTVGVMATAGQFHEDDLGDSEWMRFYVSFLRIAGAALTGVFTAIVTNYLLRARLHGALEVRRIPDGGHVVVCGLTPVGFRVVNELVQQGHRPVVIEMAADNRFVTTARRLGAAVIIGDMTVAQVLRQAHAATARAVVAATNHDLVNIETALLRARAEPEATGGSAGIRSAIGAGDAHGGQHSAGGVAARPGGAGFPGPAVRRSGAERILGARPVFRGDRPGGAAGGRGADRRVGAGRGRGLSAPADRRAAAEGPAAELAPGGAPIGRRPAGRDHRVIRPG